MKLNLDANNGVDSKTIQERKLITFRMLTKNCKHKLHRYDDYHECGIRVDQHDFAKKKCCRKNCPIWEKLK